ncbi:unnamed protein product [Rotaria sp. Silwood1]|nr:unnamed protein product [Rotaria sp. Silwood1]CAF1069876.1 unnamed protein product [Rotaria sp. Silwood1]CAF3415643.1 unnamed protein product [Rotaria sp. Silwood1]
MQQRQLIIFVLFITVTYGTQINYFEPEAILSILPDPITIFANLIQLWTNVTDCPPPSCQCQVIANVTSDHDVYPVKFLPDKPNIGAADVDDLQPDTLYSFTLSCVGTDQTMTRYNRTDYGRPSAPQNITVILNSKRLTLFWSPPLKPAGPVNNYRLIIDQSPAIDNIPNSQFSYNMKEDYIYGQKHVFYLLACNINRQNISECSNPNDGETSFIMSMTTTSTQVTNTPKNASFTCATQIDYFSLESYVEDWIVQTSIFPELIQLWSNVTDCPPPSCDCEVRSNSTDDNDNDAYPVEFMSNKPNIGSADVGDLQPDTLYSFTLNCIGSNETITRYIRTDNGYPSAPQNITVQLNSKHLTLFWSFPLLPAGSINHYKLILNRQVLSNNISNIQFSYNMTEDYIYGQKHVFYLQACNINYQNQSLCSHPNDSMATFYMPMTTTTSTQETIFP